MTKRERPGVREYVNEQRKQLICAHCGAHATDWHRDEHDTNKNLHIGTLIGLGYSLERVKEEIALCTPLCRSCHIRHTASRRPNFRCGHPKEGNTRHSPSDHPRCLICSRSASRAAYHRNK